MTNLTNLVDLLNKNVELEKKAYASYIENYTATSIAAAVKGGLPFEKAASLVKEACASSSELEMKALNFTLMEKAAEEITALQAKVAEFEKKASEEAIDEAVKEPMDKLAQLGFSKEEIKAMQSVDEHFLHKVASVVSSPVSMGTPVGFAREKTDPIIEFCFGGN